MKWMDKHYIYRRIQRWNEWINITYIEEYKDEMNG